MQNCYPPLSPVNPCPLGWPPWEPPVSGSRGGNTRPVRHNEAVSWLQGQRQGLTIIQITLHRRIRSPLFSKEIFLSLASGTGLSPNSREYSFLGAGEDKGLHIYWGLPTTLWLPGPAHTQFPGARRRDSLGLCVQNPVAHSVACHQPGPTAFCFT